MELMPCPFCASTPAVCPENPKIHGDAWASVECQNFECAAQPIVVCYEIPSDAKEGSGAYKAEAVRLWNTRTQPKDNI